MREGGRNGGKIRSGRRSRTWPRLLFAAVCALAMLRGTAAPAQPAADVRGELARTDGLLRRAERVLAGVDDPAATEVLDQARQLQTRAARAADAGLAREALRLTLAARDRLRAAADQGRGAAGPEFPRFVLDRSEALLRRVGDAVRECSSPAADARLAAAVDEQRLARAAVDERRPRVAFAHTARARSLAFAALQLAEESCAEGPNRVRRAVRRTDELLRESRWLRAAGGPTGDLFDRALRDQRDAQDALRSGRPGVALRLSLRARDGLVRALGRADRPLAPDAVGDAVRRSRRLLDDALAGPERPLPRPVADDALRHQRRAESALAQGRLGDALAEVGAVHAILDREPPPPAL